LLPLLMIFGAGCKRCCIPSKHSAKLGLSCHKSTKTKIT
jgi:hypothetical protein